MPHVRFTARTAATLSAPADAKHAEYFDAGSRIPGFGLRVTRGGKRVWFLYYRHAGRLKWLSLGTVPPMSLADARDEGRRQLHLAQQDALDPGAAKRARRVALTFDALADRFIAEYAKPRKRTWDDDARQLRMMARPVWGKDPARDITRADVRDLLADVATGRGIVTSNRLYACLSKLFRWAVAQGHLDVNPIAGLPKAGRETSRDRVLSDAELVTFLDQLDAAVTRYTRDPDDPTALPPTVALWLRLRLLTAQRGGEVAAMQWAHLDLDAGRWEIPAALMKGKRPHVVPLSPSVVRLLRAQRRNVPPEAVYVLEGGRARYLRVGVTRAFTLDDFTPHDLRRTAATGMARLGVPRFIVGRVLGHADASVTSIYDRFEYWDEKRDALTRWADYLEGLVAQRATRKGGARNVVPFTKRG